MRMRFRAFSDWATGMIVAVLAAIIINLPLWQGLLLHGEWAAPDVILESSDEVFYLTRIREVADGHPWAGHPYVFERRDQRYPLGNLWEVVLGTPMRLFDLRIKTITTVADALFPLLLVFIFWMGMRHVLPDRRWRLLLVAILFLGFEMIWWKRPISAQQTTILPLLYLWAFVSPRRSEMGLTAIRGALIGLMTLSYPFHWTYCIVAEGLLTLTLLWKDPHWNMRMRRIACVAVPLIVCALPWIITVLETLGNPDYLRTLERLGLVHRRFPAGLHLQAMLAGAGVVLYVTARKTKAMHSALIMFVLLAAGIVVLNQPLITGKEAEFSSHYRQILVFPLWMTLLWSAYQLTSTFRPLLVGIPIIGLLFIGIQTVGAVGDGMSVYESLRTQPGRDIPLHMADALNDIPGQQVILAEDEFARHFMTIYTSHYPFFTTSNHMYLMDEDTLWKRAEVQQQLFPEYRIIQRGMVGSSNLNKALHDRTMCRVRNLLRLTKEDCTRNPEDYLPPEWYALQSANPSQQDMIRVLRDAHVTYGLMRNIPQWLRAYAQTIRTVEGYELLRFDFPSP